MCLNYKSMIYSALLAFFLTISDFGVVHAQSVDLPIRNIRQETNAWCWAAVAQQIILAMRGRRNTPQQCELVAIANGAHPRICCTFWNPQCIIPGSLQQIQFLITQFGGRWTNLAPPTDPMTLYRTLDSGRPIILALNSGQSVGHVVVLRGMSFLRTRYGNVEPVLHINDPISYFTQPVPFRQLIPLWRAAIVVN